jgi:hypothetical protein
MDLLKSLNVQDLPEQQTRTSHLLRSNPDFDMKLGFDACCACGKASPKVGCESCQRIKYCSRECRREDSTCVPTITGDSGHGDVEEAEEQLALGHSSVVCALLALCNDDEDVEGGCGGSSASSSAESLDPVRRNAATDRLISEYESYPATLANVISDGPCYRDVLHKRRGGSLTVHVVGASEDAELWGGHPDPSQRRRRFHCYADALAEMAETYHLKSIVLQFFGPECPTIDVDENVQIPSLDGKKSVATLRTRTFRVDYGRGLLKGGGADHHHSAVSKPDIIVFFNPGFTCPDYDWEEAVSVLRGCGHDVPFLVTTNTEMEGLADLQYLSDRNLIRDVPPGLRDMLLTQGSDGSNKVGNNINNDVDDSNDDNSSFFNVNPACGLRVRQSGTMANDLYVKSRWIFGGVSGSLVAPRGLESNHSSSPNKKRRVEGSGNTKEGNPALV